MSQPLLDTWFCTPRRIANLVTAAESWTGTPFYQNSCVKGEGVSCHNYFAKLYFEVRFLEPFLVPKGSIRAMMTGGNPIGEWLDDHLANRLPDLLEHYQYEELQLHAGDLLGMRNKDGIWHYGIVLPDSRFTHVLRHCGVIISTLEDTTYNSRIAEIRRPQP
jgi:hypothetical protein